MNAHQDQELSSRTTAELERGRERVQRGSSDDRRQLDCRQQATETGGGVTAGSGTLTRDLIVNNKVVASTLSRPSEAASLAPACR
jgi:hypothetical protein